MIRLWRCAWAYLPGGGVVEGVVHSHSHGREVEGVGSMQWVPSPAAAAEVHRYTRVTGSIARVRVLVSDWPTAQGLAGEVVGHKHG